jgi:hypothetical protein
MFTRRILTLSLIGLFALFVSSCLTCEKKEYTWQINSDNSGRLTIKYINIMAQIDYSDEESTPEEQIATDYADLMSRFIDGTEAEQEFPQAKLIGKKLYEENGQLCGSVVLEFSDISQAKLYKYQDKSPLIYYSSDTIRVSNGTIGPKFCPFVLWDGSEKKLQASSQVNYSEDVMGLLASWKENSK